MNSLTVTFLFSTHKNQCCLLRELLLQFFIFWVSLVEEVSATIWCERDSNHVGVCGSDPESDPLADEKRPEEAALLVHVHGGGVGHGDEQAVAAAQREQPPLVGGVQRELGAPGPAGGSARLHQQDGNRVGAHLVGGGEVSEKGSVVRLMHRLVTLLDR